MPRDLFGDVTRPSISIGNRKRYTVPVSLFTHAFAIAAFVVLPLVAAPYMPGVTTPIADLVITNIVPPSPPPAPRTVKPAEHVLDRNLAPIEAPSEIAPELPAVETPDRAIDGIIGGSENLEAVLAPPPPKPVVAEPPKPVPVGGAVRRPIQTRRIEPVYPPIAMQARVQGIVIVEATISEEGRVINARILRSIPLLDQAALEAVRQWEFAPSTLNGAPVPVIMTVTVNFTLK